jgi:hypothetical protein
MNRLTRIFSITALFTLSLFAISCDDDDAGCSKQYLTKVSYDDIVENFYYNDDGTLAAMTQTISGYPPRREEYFYDGNQRLIRTELIGYWDYGFFYDDQGRVETVELYQSGTDDLTRTVSYVYGSDGKLSRRDMVDDGVLINYSLFEYPAEDKLEVTIFNLEDDETWKEMLIVHTLDNKKVPYPSQYLMGWDALGGITTQHNVIGYQVFENGMLDPSQSFSIEYTYNDRGYPTSFGDGVEVYTYSCEAVKEQ